MSMLKRTVVASAALAAVMLFASLLLTIPGDAQVLLVNPGPPVGIEGARNEIWTPQTSGPSAGWVTRDYNDVSQYIIPRYRQAAVGYHDTLPINKQRCWGPAGSVIGWGADSVIRGTTEASAYRTGTVESTDTTKTNIVFKTISSAVATNELRSMALRFTNTTTTVALRGQWRYIESNVAGGSGVASATLLTPTPALPAVPAEDEAFEIYNVQPIVKTEDFSPGWPVWGWNAGPDLTHPAGVMQPTVKDMAILGPALGTGIAEYDYEQPGYVANSLIATVDYYLYRDRWHGLGVMGTGLQVRNVGAYYIAGTAMYVSSGTGTSAGATRWYFRLKPFVGDIWINRAYRGLYYNATDGMLGRCDISDCRDYGLKITGSGVYVSGQVHTYGIWTDDPDYVANRTGVGAHITGSVVGGDWYCENSNIGMCIDANGSYLDSFYGFTCTDSILRVEGAYNGFGRVVCDAKGIVGQTSPVAVLNSGRHNSYTSMELDVEEDAVGLLCDDNNGSFGLHVGYVNASLRNGSTAIKINGALNNSVIHANIAQYSSHSGSIGLDLGDGTIGQNNEIHITTGDNAEFDPPDTFVDWPDSAGNWTTTPKATTSRVFINGAQYYPP